MALSKDKKAQQIEEVSALLESSKLTVAAKYPGTNVKGMQELRQRAREQGTVVKVVKNRLFKKALESDGRFKATDTSLVKDQLVYAFNAEDEVAPAQNLAEFAKTNPQLQMVFGLTADGQLLASADLADLASLPSKDQLRARLAGTIAAPLSGFTRIMSGNIRGVLNVLSARAENITE